MTKSTTTFHYGYFIRAAAEVARFDLDWAAEWGPRVELLIRDVASMVPMTPCSHAFGISTPMPDTLGPLDTLFGDGNNQESSSAMNAWYGIALWARPPGILNCLILACISTTPNWWPLKSIGSTSTKPISPMAFPNQRHRLGWKKRLHHLVLRGSRPHPWHQLDPLPPGSCTWEISGVRQTNLEAIGIDPLDPNAPWRDLRSCTQHW